MPLLLLWMRAMQTQTQRQMEQICTFSPCCRCTAAFLLLVVEASEC